LVLSEEVELPTPSAVEDSWSDLDVSETLRSLAAAGSLGDEL
jgi:hypothetical protein